MIKKATFRLLRLQTLSSYLLQIKKCLQITKQNKLVKYVTILKNYNNTSKFTFLKEIVSKCTKFAILFIVARYNIFFHETQEKQVY